MAKKYYLDTCIWRDYFEDRKDKFKNLGELASLFITKVTTEKGVIVVSDAVEEELSSAYSDEEIKILFSIAPHDAFQRVDTTKQHLERAKAMSKRVSIPLKDALHAVIAQDKRAIIVTRDKHFNKLEEEMDVRTPEELL